MDKCFSFEGKNPQDCIHVAWFLKCWAALKLHLFILVCSAIRVWSRAIFLLPLLSSLRCGVLFLSRQLNEKTVDRLPLTAAPGFLFWLFSVLFFFTAVGRDVFQKYSSEKAFNSFKICGYQMVSVKIIVPSWRWRPVIWQHLFPGVPQASSVAERVQQYTCFTPEIPWFVSAAFLFGNDLTYHSVYCMIFNQ